MEIVNSKDLCEKSELQLKCVLSDESSISSLENY